MSATKAAAILSIVVSVMFLWASWQWRNVGLLLLSGVFLNTTSIAISHRLAKYLVPIAGTFLTLAVFEFLIPVVTPSVESKTHFDSNSDYVNGYYRQVEGFGYIPNSGVHVSRKLTASGEEIYSVIYSIGEDGYRDSEIPEPFEIYLYGGSFVFGEGLDDDETLAYFLWIDHSLQVKSLGVHGYGLHQALYNIEKGVTTKQGINILLTAPWHSLRNSCKPAFALSTPRYVVLDNYAKLDGVCSSSENSLYKISEYSNIVQLVKSVFANKSEIRDEDIELYLAIIRSIKRETLKNNSKLLVAFMKGTDEQMKFTKHSNETLLDEISTISDLTVDVTLSDTLQRYYIHELDRHPSATANRERARLIARAVLELKARD